MEISIPFKFVAFNKPETPQPPIPDFCECDPLYSICSCMHNGLHCGACGKPICQNQIEDYKAQTKKQFYYTGSVAVSGDSQTPLNMTNVTTTKTYVVVDDPLTDEKVQCVYCGTYNNARTRITCTSCGNPIASNP